MAQASPTDRMWEVVLKVMVPLSIGIGSWLLATAIAHESRISIVESTRFTNKDAAELERRIHVEEALLRADLNVIKTNVAVIRQILEEK